MRTHFHLFVYGSLRSNGGASRVLEGAEKRVRAARVRGTIYEIDGRYPALVLYGGGPVDGEIWRCPVELLPRLDAYEGVADGLYRRCGVEVDGFACWVYVAGPRLASRLTPDARIERWVANEDPHFQA